MSFILKQSPPFCLSSFFLLQALAMSSSVSRKSKGRQRVEMKKMTNENNLQATFSKRRTGLFKKASELCTLTGAEVGLIVFSPSDKAYSFGQPNIDTVVGRYLTGAPPTQIPPTKQILEAFRNVRVRELNAELSEVMNHLEIEKKRSEELNNQQKAMQAMYWWAASPDDFTRPELEKMKEVLEDLKKSLTRETDRGLLNIQSASNPAQFHAGSSSSDPMPLTQRAAPSQAFPPLQMLRPPPMIQSPAVQQNPMFDGNMMPLPLHGLNNMVGYGTRSGFY